MPQFIVTVKDKEGKKQYVKREAPDQSELVERVHREGFFVIQVKGISREQAEGKLAGWKEKALLGRQRGPRVRSERLVFFTRQMATMVSAGLPLVKALRGLATEEKTKFKRVLSQVADDVEHGSTFSEALREHPRIFNRLYVSLVKSGEESGHLDVILAQLADYLEAIEEIRMRVKAALRYPVFIFGFVTLIFAGFLLVVVPKFGVIYANFDAQLPGPTVFVMAVSYFIRDNLLLLLLLAGLLVFVLKMLVNTEKGRLVWDTLKLRFPVFGKIVQKVVVSRLARTMAVLSHSGLPIVHALNVVSRAANNVIYERAMLDVRRRVQAGQTLGEAMQKTGIFPVLLTQMVTTGEETGTMDVMFSKVAVFYEKQVKATVESIIPLIEPFLIVALGFVVGCMLVVMYLPIFKLGQVIR